MTVKYQMQDIVLTAIDSVVKTRGEMALSSITKSSKRGPSSVVQNTDWRDFTGNTENTTLMSASSRRELNIVQDKNDETRNVEIS